MARPQAQLGRYLQWLFEAWKRYGLSILNYTVTSNHVYLLVRDDGDKDVIPRSIPRIAGRTGQEFNQKKSRNEAYWEDRYHATPIAKDNYLIQCLVYIDLNMVRAGVVEDPREWAFAGYNEIQSPRERYALVDCEGLRRLLGFRSVYDLAEAHRGWVEESLKKGIPHGMRSGPRALRWGVRRLGWLRRRSLGSGLKGVR